MLSAAKIIPKTRAHGALLSTPTPAMTRSTPTIMNTIPQKVRFAKRSLFMRSWFFANLTFWGIVFMIVGVLLVIAGVGVLNKAPWARVFGIIFAALSMIFYFMVIWAYPAWSILVIAIDVLVIYG